jgi:hypothetical protein
VGSNPTVSSMQGEGDVEPRSARTREIVSSSLTFLTAHPLLAQLVEHSAENRASGVRFPQGGPTGYLPKCESSSQCFVR